MSAVINLESICAKYGMMMADAGTLAVKDKENVITRALAVLAENGFYAMNVFLLSCNQATYGIQVEEVLLKMLTSKELSLLSTHARGTQVLNDLRTITEDLPRLILARRVTEQALTFARYHCKAMEKEAKVKGKEVGA